MLVMEFRRSSIELVLEMLMFFEIGSVIGRLNANNVYNKVGNILSVYEINGLSLICSI